MTGRDAQAEEGILTVEGVHYEFRRLPAREFRRPPAGAGASGPTLVLLHEGLGCVGLWKDFPDRLCDATGLPVFLWSRQGFGQSDPITLPRPLDYLQREALRVGRVLDVAGIGRCVLVGHSDGGTIALLHAAGPEASRVEAVVTMAAHVFVEDVTIEGIKVARHLWYHQRLRERLRRWHGDNVDGAFYGWCETWLHPDFRDWNIEAALPAIRVPCLVLQGEADEYGTPEQVHAIARQVSGPAEAILLPGVGHAPHVDAPDAVIGAISALLARIGAVEPT